MQVSKTLLLLAFASLSLSACNVYVTPNTGGQPNGNNNNYRCAPANGQTYNQAYNLIKDRRMGSDKLSTARQQTANLGCLTSQQISDITGLLMMESDKLNYAKYAYAYCADPSNYGIINRHLMMDSSKRELGQLTGVN